MSTIELAFIFILLGFNNWLVEYDIKHPKGASYICAIGFFLLGISLLIAELVNR